MQTTHQPIRYIVDSMAFDFLVRNNESTQEQRRQPHIGRPWLTVCVEPVSRLLIAHVLSTDSPNLSQIQSALCRALTCPHELPAGSIPDEIWLDRSFSAISPIWQSLFRQLSIQLYRMPLANPHRGTVERIFASLQISLQALFSRAEATGSHQNPRSEKNIPFTSLQLEEWCAEWVTSFNRSLLVDTGPTHVTIDHISRRMRYLDPHQLNVFFE